MTLADFKKLSVEGRREAVQKRGFRMVHRNSLHDTVSIYMVDDFFVKVSLSKCTDAFFEIKGYNPADLPHHYYQQIAYQCELTPTAVSPMAIPDVFSHWPAETHENQAVRQELRTEAA